MLMGVGILAAELWQEPMSTVALGSIAIPDNFLFIC
jgi:hypothetical protein